MKSILIIDEEQWVIELLVDTIEKSTGGIVTIAISCSDAVELFKQNNYDYIILDLMLPAGEYEIIKDIIKDDRDLMFGLQLLKFFRKENKTVKIIGHSIADTDEIRQSFSEQNANYVSKFSENSIERIVKLMTTEEM